MDLERVAARSRVARFDLAEVFRERDTRRVACEADAEPHWTKGLYGEAKDAGRPGRPAERTAGEEPCAQPCEVCGIRLRCDRYLNEGMVLRYGPKAWWEAAVEEERDERKEKDEREEKGGEGEVGGAEDAGEEREGACALCCWDEPLGARGVLLGDDPRHRERPALAWTGKSFGVAWTDHQPLGGEGPRGVSLGILSADGKILGQRQVSEPARDAHAPALVWTGSVLGVAYVAPTIPGSVHRDVWLNQFAAAGQPQGLPVRIPSDSPAMWPALAWTGEEYGVVWWVPDARRMYFARVSPNGEVLFRGKLEPTPDDPEGMWGGETPPAGPPALVWSGDRYGLAWAAEVKRRPAVYFTELSSLGERWATAVVRRGELVSPPSLVQAGRHTMAWGDAEERRVYVSRQEQLGGVDWQTVVLSEGYEAWQTSLVYGGCHYAVAWQEGRGPGAEVLFARLDSDLERQGPMGRVLASTSWAAEPSLVWADCRYALAAAIGMSLGESEPSRVALSQGCDPAPQGCCWLPEVETVCWEDHEPGRVVVPDKGGEPA